MQYIFNNEAENKN